MAEMSAQASSESPNVVVSGGFNEPVEDPYNKAISYLEKHNILQLFQHLTSDVIYNRPSDPLDHLIKEVQQLKERRDKNVQK